MTPGEKLKQWRESRGMSIKQASRLSPVTHPTWADYERGKSIPGLSKAEELEQLTLGAIRIADWERELVERWRRTNK